MILCPLWPAFFSKFPIILWNVWFDFPLAIFSPQYIVCERTIIAWPKGEKISYIFPQLDLCSFSVTIKIIGEKILYYVPYCPHIFLPLILLNIVWFDFPLAIFFPFYTVSESRTNIAWSNGEKRHRGKKYHIFSPSLIFVLFLAQQLK